MLDTVEDVEDVEVEEEVEDVLVLELEIVL